MNLFEQLQRNGFDGFIRIRDLMENINAIPKKKGVYMVLREKLETPHFCPKGTGGFFNGKDPNVPIAELEANWINNERVLYIGKAGGKKSTLHTRIKRFLSFGQGKAESHWGGRLIWQLKDAKDLVICWKILENKVPREVEKAMIQKFKKEHNGKRPFANLKD